MDWRYNTIWFEQIESNNYLGLNLKDNPNEILNLTNQEYAILLHFKANNKSFSNLPNNENLKYLEMRCASFKNLEGIEKFKNLKRLELDGCAKLIDDKGIEPLADTLEFLHIRDSKRFKPNELYKLKNLKVLCLNNCGQLENLDFLYLFPNLIDFRFVDTNIISGDLSPIIGHPSLKTVGFLDKRHYNIKNIEIDNILGTKEESEYKDFAHKGQYVTFKYKIFGKSFNSSETRNTARLLDWRATRNKLNVPLNVKEIVRREKIARAAIKNTFGTEKGEFSVTLFVTHHLEELESYYWEEHFNTKNPEPIRVLDILELRSHWGDENEDGIDVFDFTLPDGVTDYVISVRFDNGGKVKEISMES